MFEQLLGHLIQGEFWFSVLRITAPILFAALAAVIAEKAGVTNIGLEGIMMIGALFGTLISYWTQNWWLGVLGAMVIGTLLGLGMGFFALKLKTDIILTGIAVNMIGEGGTIFLLYLFTGLRGNTSSLTTSKMLIPRVELPLIKEIPVLGRIVSGHSVLTYVAFLLVFVTWVLLYKTPLGLRIRGVGENPHAADSVGVSVRQIRYIALSLSGAFAGLGGAYMSMYYAQSWNLGMVAGRGFIALAAQAMGRGEPVGTMFASLLFGLANALKNKMEGMAGLSSYLVASIPYVITILGLTIYAWLMVKKRKKSTIPTAE